MYRELFAYAAFHCKGNFDIVKRKGVLGGDH